MADKEKLKIFVFGSNLAGIHGAGSARAAWKEHGAIFGQGVGRQGNSYAIPTKDANLNSMKLEDIKPYVLEFIKYATEHPELNFSVVKIGCGLAGFTEKDIGPMFKGSPRNVWLPVDFIDAILLHTDLVKELMEKERENEQKT